MQKTLSIQQALIAAREQLTSNDAAGLEAEVLLAHVLGKPRDHVRVRSGQMLTELQQERFSGLIKRRAAGEPVAYLTGHREFWSLDLSVNRHTLIPRPETELLVELALQRIAVENETRVADLGTGSGAIALAIAAERPPCRIIATDICAEALAIARDNAERLRLPNVEFRQGAWFTPLARERFDLIASNPPYIAQDDPHLVEGDLPAEPRHALVGGVSGLEMLEVIISAAPAHLQDGGWLLLEHGYDQASAVTHLLLTGGFRNIQTWRDTAGIERVSGGQRG